MNSDLKKLKKESRELKCINGAMYFGSVEDDSCNCNTRCQNEQTYTHALKEFDSFIEIVYQSGLRRGKEEVWKDVNDYLILNYKMSIEEVDDMIETIKNEKTIYDSIKKN